MQSISDYTPQEVGTLKETATSVELHWTISKNLKPKIHHFNIRYNPKGDQSPFSYTVWIKTMESLTKKFSKQEYKLGTGAAPSIFKMPLEEFYRHKPSKLRKCRVKGVREDPSYKEKTIMVVGATGVGKSTLIDGLINFHLGVAWNETARFKLISLTPEEEEKRTEAESTTEWITCYYLPWMSGCRVEYNLRIIDTPGFGDCRGITRDKELVKQIEAFFTLPRDQGIDTLDAVWFVVQSPNCRLTPIQQYIFDSILAIFGKDIEENIFALITFADTDSPPALYLLNKAEIPLKGTYIFNNAALFADSKENTKYGLKFWKMSMQGFELFFKDLKDKKIAQKSLRQTKEVLRTREELEVNISRIRRQIIEGTQEQSRMRKGEQNLKQHEREVADNEDFEYTVKEPGVVSIDLPIGKYALTCLYCNRYCHIDCIYADDQMMNCSAMTYDRHTKDARCGSCDDKCIWSQHKSYPYLIKRQERLVTKTNGQMKEKYFIAKEELEKTTTIVEKIKGRYDAVMEQKEKLVTEIKECITRLKEIALKPNPISEIEYINILIEDENDGRKEGYKDRVHILEELRSKAEIRKEIIDNPDIKELSINDTK